MVRVRVRVRDRVSGEARLGRGECGPHVAAPGLDRAARLERPHPGMHVHL